MRRVLVPLDGTDLAAAILPDAFRLAGHDGELILIRHVADVHDGGHSVVDAAQLYLNTVAQTLRAEGIHVRTQPLVSEDAAVAIDEAAQRFNADMIAVATHGRTAAERWHEGSIAWRALLRSTVPVLIRHVDPYNPFDETPKIEHRRIMVPLDGSELAESALPLAQELARAWSASTWLVRAVEGSPADAPSARDSLDVGNRAGAEVYLSGIAGRLSGDIHSTVLEGPAADSLIMAQQELQITDVVMSSHGRTAVSRAIVGSVLDQLIHALRCPIVVVPMLAALARESVGERAGFGFEEHTGI